MLLDYLVNVRATLLDDATWYVPFIETWTSEKVAWASAPVRHGDPPMAAYPRLIEASAATRRA